MSVSYSRLFLAVMVTLLLQACAAPDGRVAYPRQPAPAQPAPPPTVRVTPMDIPRPIQARPLPPVGAVDPNVPRSAPATSVPVVVSLLSDARVLQQAGRFDQAASRIERGLRISPKDAQLWQRLAEIRLQQKRYHQVVATAKKSNGLARGNAPLQAKNWQLIREARHLMGDTAGAEKARQKAVRYQSF